MVDAQFSIPFCVALACVGGRDTMLPLPPASLRDFPVARVAAKVEPTRDKEMDNFFPVLAPAIVTVSA